MTRDKVIVNPNAGRSRGEEIFSLIEKEFRRLDLDFEMCRTEAPGHVIELAKEVSTKGFDVVVAVRGDGTAKVTVTANHGFLPAHADRETLCEAGERLGIEVVPQILEVIVP